MSDSTVWRTLYRCDDLMQARAVATSIEAMEYEVQIRFGEGDEATTDGERDISAEFKGPFSVQVPERDWPELARVLDEIVQEQVEFDQQIQQRQRQKRRSGLIIAIAMLLVVMLWRIVRLLH